MSRGVSRREFLKTVVITAGAAHAAPLLGCSSSGSTNPDAPTSPDAAGAAFSFPQSVASGDPRPASIVLWTRAASSGTTDVPVTLEVATDKQFTQLVTLSTSQLTARAETDFCLRVKVISLTAATRYYYRFRAGTVVSPTGRFKTALTSTTDVAVKFGFVSCQDWIGRYYNTLLEYLDPSNDDVDFIVHLGDYIYETTGDPSFQSTGSHGVTFTDQPGAIQLGSPSKPFYAAKSVSNYRELYKAYRSDTTLQKVHENFPIINIWDDHEFSNDCWKDVATYYDGLKDETDLDRRQNAEQAFFEYQPIAIDVETGSGELSLTRDELFPNMKLYRDFRFGKNLHLILTDFRSFRPDHPIPEDGYPGKIVMDQAALTEFGPSLEDKLTAPYINLAGDPYGDHRAMATQVLTAKCIAAGVDASKAADLAAQAATGLVDVDVINQYWDDSSQLHIDASKITNRGISYYRLGKAKDSLFAEIGTRYLVVQPTYDVWAAYRVSKDEQADNPYGVAQSQWLDDKLAAESDATWKIMGSSTSQTSLMVNLTGLSGAVGGAVPDTTLYLDCDGWDGFPVGRQALHAKLAAKNVVIISGDIHASYVADFGADDTGNRLVELTGPGISSQSFAGELHSEAALVPALAPYLTVVDGLINALDDAGTKPGFLTGANSTLRYTNSKANGVVVVTVDGSKLTGKYALLDGAEALTDSTGSPSAVASKFIRVTVEVPKTAGKNGAVTVTT